MPHAAILTLLAVLGIGVYLPSLGAPFVYDDEHAIVRNPSIRSLAASLSPPDQPPTTNRPLANLSFAVNWALSGDDPRPYRLCNALLHAGAGLLLFGALRRLLSRSAAFATAALWLVHPLQTEAVVYVTQRTELLMGLLSLATVYLAMRGFEDGVHRARWFAAAGVASALGMLAKEVMVVAPLLVLLIDRTFFSASTGEALRTRRGLYAGLAAGWALLAVVVAHGSRSLSVGAELGVSPLDWLRTQAGVVTWYQRLALWPDPLSIVYGWPIARTWGEALPELALQGAAVALCAVALVRRHPLGMAGAWLYLLLAPTSSVLPIPTEVAAERRMYLPLAAVLAVLVAGGDRLLRVSLPARARVAATAAVVLLLVAANFDRQRDFRSAEALFGAAARARPDDDLARVWYGATLVGAGRLAEGAAQYERALAVAPDNRRARSFLAGVRLRTGDFEGAIREARTGLARAPESQAFRRLLVRALVASGRFGEARAVGAALRLEPAAGPDAALDAIDVYLLLGRLDDASRVCERLIARYPDLAVPYDRLAWILATHPDATRRDGARAVALAERAVALTRGEDASALDSLAVAYARAGRFGRAADTARRAAATARAAGDHEPAARIAERAELFARGQAFAMGR